MRKERSGDSQWLPDKRPRVPVLADKILKGTPFGWIPVESTITEFFVNLKIDQLLAQALGKVPE